MAKIRWRTKLLLCLSSYNAVAYNADRIYKTEKNHRNF